MFKTEGRALEQKRIRQLLPQLLKEERWEDIQRLSEDPDYFVTLYRAYGIELLEDEKEESWEEGKGAGR